jgi:thiol-disulfide isomerase/thioredoxin
VLGLCAFLVAALLLGASSATFAAPAALGSSSLINKKAPEITRKDLDGREITLRRYRGKVVLLTFWATWCAPCQVEMPIFAKWQRQYGPDRFQVVAVSMDDDAPPVRRLLAKMKVNYPVAMGDAALGKLYGGVLGLPLTYLVDGNGVVRAKFQGEINASTIERRVKQMLEAR